MTGNRNLNRKNRPGRAAVQQNNRHALPKSITRNFFLVPPRVKTATPTPGHGAMRFQSTLLPVPFCAASGVVSDVVVLEKTVCGEKGASPCVVSALAAVVDPMAAAGAVRNLHALIWLPACHTEMRREQQVQVLQSVIPGLAAASNQFFAAAAAEPYDVVWTHVQHRSPAGVEFIFSKDAQAVGLDAVMDVVPGASLFNDPGTCLLPGWVGDVAEGLMELPATKSIVLFAAVTSQDGACPHEAQVPRVPVISAPASPPDCSAASVRAAQT